MKIFQLYLKEKLKQLKSIFWNNKNAISFLAIASGLCLALVNYFFIDWAAFVFHGGRELEIMAGSGMDHFLNSFQNIIFSVCAIIIAYNLLVITLKKNKAWLKILSYFTFFISITLMLLLFHVAFGFKEAFSEFIIYNLFIIIFVLTFLGLFIFFIVKCKFKNKLTATLTIIVLFCLSLLPLLPKTPFAFRSDPVVFDGGDSYTIAFATTSNALAWVECTINGETIIIYDIEDAIARVNDKFHKINVPKTNTNNERVESLSYTINSKRFIWRSAAFYKFGKEIKSKVYNFTTIPMNPSEVKVGVFSDVHGKYQEANKANNYMGNCDIYLILGDMQTATFTTHQALKNVDFAGTISKGEKLVYPVRGNHESRGSKNHLWTKYMITPSSAQHYTFEYNGLNVIMLDTGDDHDDNAPINGGVSFWKEHTQKQLEWLDTLEFNFPKWLLAASHINFISEEYHPDYIKYLNPAPNNIELFHQPLGALGIAMLIHGHDHTSGPKSLVLPNEDNLNAFATYCVGGAKSKQGTFVASQITFSETSVRMIQYDNFNNIKFDYSLPLS